MRKRSRRLRIEALENRLTPATLTWDGGGTNALWSNPANWVGDVAPTPNASDILVFPAGAAQVTNTNDFAPNSQFRRIDLRGPDYRLGGNSVLLSDGITAESPTAVPVANFPVLTILLSQPPSANFVLAGDANLGVILTNGLVIPTNGSVTATGRYVINGGVSGGGSFSTAGDLANVTLFSNLTYTGGTNVGGGSLLLQSDLPANSSTSVVGFATNPAVLRGTGPAGNLSVGNNGILDPGTAGPGTFSATQFLLGGGTYRVDINDTAAGSYDQLVVANQVQLNGQLVLNLGGTLVNPGERLRIIDNQGSAAVSGTFTNLPEGAVVATGDRVRYTITYVGGDGNDVELVTAPGPALFTWDGGGADANWTTAANWVGDVAPTAGAALTFPAGAARTTNTNDFTAGTAFDSILVAAGYQLGGNAVTLANGVTGEDAPAAGGGAAVNLDVTLTAAQTFGTDNTPFTLTFGGAVNLNGFTLSTSATGAVVLNGVVSGAGGIVHLTGNLGLYGNNTYTGLTDSRAGALTLGSSNALGATGAGNDTQIANGVTVTFVNQGGVQVVSPEVITFGTPSGFFFLNSVPGTAGPVILTGPLTFNAGGNASSGIPGALVFAGPIAGNGNLSLSGLTVAASSNSPGYTGFISGVQVDGQLPAARVNGGVLSGTGRVGIVDLIGGGTVSPGGNGGLDVGTLSTGDLTIRPGSGGRIPIFPGNFQVDVTAAGADRVNVTGAVSLGGNLLLNVPANLVFTAGTRYRIIDNDGADPVANPSLSGFGEGAVVATRGTTALRITFRGGDGNDVELVAGPASRRIAVGAGQGGGPQVNVYNGDGSLVRAFNAYAPNFRGGVRVAQGDFNRDGIDEVVTAAGVGGGPHVRVWDGASGALINEFFAYGASFTGGVFVSVGDVNGDGTLDIVTGTGNGGGPHVRVFNQAGGVIGEFFAYDASFRGGVSVATGDMTGDGVPEIVTGPGPGGGSHVKIFTGVNGTLASQFFAFDGFFGGISVAVSPGTVYVAPLAGGGPTVRSFLGTGALQGQFNAYPTSFRGGVTLATRDVDGDGTAEIITGPGAGGAPLVSVFEPNGFAERSFFAFDPAFLGGIFVG